MKTCIYLVNLFIIFSFCFSNSALAMKREGASIGGNEPKRQHLYDEEEEICDEKVNSKNFTVITDALKGPKLKTIIFREASCENAISVMSSMGPSVCDFELWVKIDSDEDMKKFHENCQTLISENNTLTRLALYYSHQHGESMDAMFDATMGILSSLKLNRRLKKLELDEFEFDHENSKHTDEELKNNGYYTLIEALSANIHLCELEQTLGWKSLSAPPGDIVHALSGKLDFLLARNRKISENEYPLYSCFSLVVDKSESAFSYLLPELRGYISLFIAQIYLEGIDQAVICELNGKETD